MLAALVSVVIATGQAPVETRLVGPIPAPSCATCGPRGCCNFIPGHGARGGPGGELKPKTLGMVRYTNHYGFNYARAYDYRRQMDYPWTQQPIAPPPIGYQRSESEIENVDPRSARMRNRANLAARAAQRGPFANASLNRLWRQQQAPSRTAIGGRAPGVRRTRVR